MMSGEGQRSNAEQSLRHFMGRRELRISEPARENYPHEN